MRGTGGRLDGRETGWECIPLTVLPCRAVVWQHCVPLLKGTIPQVWSSPAARVLLSYLLPPLAPLGLGVVKPWLVSFNLTHTFVNCAFIQLSPILSPEYISARTLTLLSREIIPGLYCSQYSTKGPNSGKSSPQHHLLSYAKAAPHWQPGTFQ